MRETTDVFEKIVVAYDDSPGARRALEIGVDLARRPGVELTAAAVEAHLPHYGATVGEVDEERAVEEQACQRWLRAAEAYADEHGVKLHTMILAGHPAEKLVQAAQQSGADLLILGHSGHSAVWGRFLGGTVEKVSRHATCSVLIAAPPEGRT
jgi:nucleotide-binding universal stress UspA family protein